MVGKALADILQTWADKAMVDKKVLEYHVQVLTQNILDRKVIAGADPGDYVVFLTQLRMKAVAVTSNANLLAKIPGVEVVRSKRDRASLEEVRMHLDDLVRYRIEPLIRTICANGMVRSPASTLSVLQSQLSYDERSLRAAQDREQSLREAFNTYEKDAAAPPLAGVASGGNGREKPPAEMVTPVVNDTFLDRIARLYARDDDRTFRQTMVMAIRDASLETITPASNVAYDRELIESVKAARAGGADAAAETRVKNDVDEVYGELQGVVASLSEIHEAASKQLNPVTELFTFAAAPSVRREAALDPIRLLAFGLMLFLISVPFVIAGCLIHERVEIENKAEAETEPLVES
jgi:hypothetical protein